MAEELYVRDVAARYETSEKRVRQIARELGPRRDRYQRHVWNGWDDPELARVIERLANGEARKTPEEWDLTVSSKNQVTLPVAALRELRVKSGDRLRAAIRGRSLVLLPHPLSWVDYYAGIAEGLYGQTDEEIDAYIRESRGEWEPLEA